MHRSALVRVHAHAADVERVLSNDLGATRGADGTWRGAVHNDPTTGGELTVTVRPAHDEPGQLDVELTVTTETRVPFFGGVVEGLVGLHYERALAWAEARLRAALEGDPPPSPPRPIVLLPPVPFTGEQAALMMTAGFAIAVATFGQSIIGQFAGDVAKSFGTTDDRLGVSLAILRVGALVALFAGALTDRIGRRRVVLVSLVGVAVANLVSAFAPNLATLTVAQTFTRGFSGAAVIAAGIAAIEEAPEGGRAFATSFLALTGGVGFTLTVVLLPFGDRFPSAWRVVLLLSAASIVVNRRIAAALFESHRYTRIVATRIRRGRLGEVFSSRYTGRLALLAAAAFLTNLLAAPSAQLTNKYLTDVHNYSNSAILGFRAATTALPGFVGLIVAGRLSERYGRRPVASVALALGAVIRAIFFLTSGPLLWVTSALGDAALACGFIAIGTLNTELFPTETRGTSNGVVVLVGVIGSATGLLLAGALSDPLGGLGRSIALTTGGTLVAALLVVPFLPEASHLDLDEISPSIDPG